MCSSIYTKTSSSTISNLLPVRVSIAVERDVHCCVHGYKSQVAFQMIVLYSHS